MVVVATVLAVLGIILIVTGIYRKMRHDTRRFFNAGRLADDSLSDEFIIFGAMTIALALIAIAFVLPADYAGSVSSLAGVCLGGLIVLGFRADIDRRHFRKESRGTTK